MTRREVVAVADASDPAPARLGTLAAALAPAGGVVAATLGTAEGDLVALAAGLRAPEVLALIDPELDDAGARERGQALGLLLRGRPDEVVVLVDPAVEREEGLLSAALARQLRAAVLSRVESAAPDVLPGFVRVRLRAGGRLQTLRLRPPLVLSLAAHPAMPDRLPPATPPAGAAQPRIARRSLRDLGLPSPRAAALARGAARAGVFTPRPAGPPLTLDLEAMLGAVFPLNQPPAR